MRLTVNEPEQPEDCNGRYFAEMAARGPALNPLGKPCHDCAVECNFYKEFSDALAQQPEHIIREASARWFCHNQRDRACRGNINNIERQSTP